MLGSCLMKFKFTAWRLKKMKKLPLWLEDYSKKCPVKKFANVR
jgi:hypothetical protein